MFKHYDIQSTKPLHLAGRAHLPGLPDEKWGHPDTWVLDYPYQHLTQSYITYRRKDNLISSIEFPVKSAGLDAARAADVGRAPGLAGWKAPMPPSISSCCGARIQYTEGQYHIYRQTKESRSEWRETKYMRFFRADHFGIMVMLPKTQKKANDTRNIEYTIDGKSFSISSYTNIDHLEDQTYTYEDFESLIFPGTYCSWKPESTQPVQDSLEDGSEPKLLTMYYGTMGVNSQVPLLISLLREGHVLMFILNNMQWTSGVKDTLLPRLKNDSVIVDIQNNIYNVNYLEKRLHYIILKGIKRV